MKPTLRLLKEIPRPTRQSPLFTSQRWDGLDKKLVLPSPTPPPIDISTNVFARLLATPARIDRPTRLLSLPRALLMRYTPIRHPETHELWYVPAVNDDHLGAGSGYGPNSRAAVRALKKRFASVASLELLSDTYNVTGLQDFKWNEDNWCVIEALYLEELMREMDGLQSEREVCDGALVIRFDEGEKLGVDGGVTVVNLGQVEVHHPSYQEFKESLEELAHENQVIIHPRHTKFIDTFVRFIIYTD